MSRSTGLGALWHDKQMDDSKRTAQQYDAMAAD
jgi:hypothetical protein